MNKTILLLFPFLLFACHSKIENAEQTRDLKEGHAYKNQYNKQETLSDLDETAAEEKEVSLSDRLLIKTADLFYEKKDLPTERNRIHELLKEFKGYTLSEDEYHYDNSKGINITVKVPSHEFDSFIAKVGSGVTNFTRKDIFTEDVTSEFVDAQARIKSKKALEDRYLILLSKANQMEDMLMIEEKLSEVRNDIEGIQGRLNYLQTMTKYSTIHLKISYPVPVNKNQKPGFGARSQSAFQRGWDALVTFFVNIISAWPAITISLIIFLILRKYYQNYKRKNLSDKA